MAADDITAATFDALFHRISEQIRINGTLLLMGKWAERTAGPWLRALVGQLVQGLPVQFPGVFGEIDPADPTLDAKATEFLQSGVRAIDAAALVFGHTVTDNVVDELLEISARAVPSRWHAEREEFTLNLADLGQLVLEDFATRARNRLVQRQRGRSLPEKLQHLFTVSRCGPDAFGIKLDNALLLDIDRARHKIVHGGIFDGHLDRLNDMLGAALAAAEAALFAVASSCGYEYVEGRVGAVFRAIEPQEK